MNKNIDPKKFGPYGWYIIHNSAYLVSNATEYKYFTVLINTFSNIIPCEKCRHHFIDYLRKHPIPNNINLVFKWSSDFHNSVNKRLNKNIIDTNKPLVINNDIKAVWYTLYWLASVTNNSNKYYYFRSFSWACLNIFPSLDKFKRYILINKLPSKEATNEDLLYWLLNAYNTVKKTNITYINIKKYFLDVEDCKTCKI